MEDFTVLLGRNKGARVLLQNVTLKPQDATSAQNLTRILYPRRRCRSRHGGLEKRILYMSKSLRLMLALTMAVAGSSFANAGWKRVGGGTTSGGQTWSSTASGSCSGGSCSSSGVVTGPYGGQTTRTNTLKCSYGVCSTTHQVVGPRGNGWTRYGTFSRN
jgi:hypothetical protein